MPGELKNNIMDGKTNAEREAGRIANETLQNQRRLDLEQAGLTDQDVKIATGDLSFLSTTELDAVSDLYLGDKALNLPAKGTQAGVNLQSPSNK